MGLWDRVNDKRKQKHKDDKQNDEIKELKEKIEKQEKNHQERDERRMLRGPDDVGGNFQMSQAMIQRQYDEGYGRLGKRFAMGDTVTENQLQAQVIQLQQTVITILQDALYNDRPLSRADMAKLISASNSAREGSIDALRQQQARLAIEPPQPQRPLSLPPTRPASIAAIASNTDPLYCRYSTDLQYIPNKPLAADFAPGGPCRCPACGLRLPVTSDDFWVIGKRTPLLSTDNRFIRREAIEREFHLGQRFVVKCHTPDGMFACVLCNKHRERDAICKSVDALVNHVGKFHDVDELERDFDLWEKTGMEVAVPLAPMPPSAMKKERVVEEIVYR